MKLLAVSTTLMGIVCGLVSGASQDKASTVQKAGDCSINVTGNNNTASLVCKGVDRRLAEQVQAIINGTRRNESAVKEMSGKLDLILKQMFKDAIPPDVGLRFVIPMSPALVIVNQSASIAREIRWQVTLWNIDIPERMDPLPISTTPAGWLKPNTQFAPQDIFSAVGSLLKQGDRLVGSAGINCAECDRGRTYLVYIVWGQDGWFSEVESERSGNILMPIPPVTKEKLGTFFNQISSVPAKLRTPIGNFP